MNDKNSTYFETLRGIRYFVIEHFNGKKVRYVHSADLKKALKPAPKPDPQPDSASIAPARNAKKENGGR